MAIRIQEHVPLRELTTLKIGGTARYFVSASSSDELKEAVGFAKEKKLPFVLLGGGSNVLFSDTELNAVVVKNEIRGVKWESPLTKGALPSPACAEAASAGRSAGGLLQPPAHQNASIPFSKGDFVFAVAGAGESWDILVAEAVKRRLWGIENLSGIPGTVGAAPIQNIGAYGTEIKDVLAWVEALDTKTGKIRTLSNRECFFGYRDSIFKTPNGKTLIITRVALRLSENGKPNLEYKDLRERFKIYDLRFKKEETDEKRPELTPADIRGAVLEIRSKKFPDLNEFGTAGSFFKNPIISQKQFNALKKKYPDLPGFPLLERFNLKLGKRLNLVKVSLAWILDNICGFKGYTKGNVALFERQPIVLVATCGATAEEIRKFSEEIAARVKEKTGIEIEWEVQRVE